MYPSRPQGPIQKFFSGLTEYTFQSRLGVADPPLVDYISGLLARFLRCDSIYQLRGLTGERLDQVADMLAEANARIGESKREAHRHIGDFTLFWTGLYPEALKRLQAGSRRDYLLDYAQQGKRNYYIASTICPDAKAAENELLERLSHDFELCAYGLGELRREWERRDGEDGPPLVL